MKVRIRLIHKKGKFYFRIPCCIALIAMLSITAKNAVFGQGDWAWMSGKTSADGRGLYGELGGSFFNGSPGSREGSAIWLDSLGNTWLFGGYGYARGTNEGFLNDLWIHIDSSNQWVWVSGNNQPNLNGNYGTIGVSSSSNYPGSRAYSANWIDSLGNLWIFGGQGYAENGSEGNLNDLWKFDPVLKEWTWIKGSSSINSGGSYGTIGQPSQMNLPSARKKAAYCVDENWNFWLFGGLASGSLNDLWKFDLGTGNWTWINGSNTTNQTGLYGSMGVSSSNNRPGARYNTSMVCDTAGMIWLFGGTGYTTNLSSHGRLNDLWRLELSSLDWTWVSGSNNVDEYGSYGSLGLESGSNMPGGRTAHFIGQYDSTLLLFGGLGYSSIGADAQLNDLWIFNFGSGNWTWIRGSDTALSDSYYGVLNIGDSNTIPGARCRFAAVSGHDKLKLYGGDGIADSNNTGLLADLWTYDIANQIFSWNSGDSLLDQRSHYGRKGDTITKCHPGARKSPAIWKDSLGHFWMFGGSGFGEYGNQGRLNDLWKFDPQNNQWTWIGGKKIVGGNGNYGNQGQPSNLNWPSARFQSSTWKDSADCLWLFGGLTFNSQRKNDLWKYDLASGQWTWIMGPTSSNDTGFFGVKTQGDSNTLPCSRSNACSWTEDGRYLLLFGGLGRAIDSTNNGLSLGPLNDLWKYDIQTGVWSWMHGSRYVRHPGNHGTKNAPTNATTPGARHGAIYWTDTANRLWVFGGATYYSNSSWIVGVWEDLWFYNPETNQWTWKRGSKNLDQHPDEGVIGVPHQDNSPGSRTSSSSWTDQHGNLWLFGGSVLQSGNTMAGQNDLWKYSPVINRWIMIRDFTGAQWGTQGVPNPNNAPPYRSGSRGWCDSENNFWMFGGANARNDLWKFENYCEIPDAPELDSSQVSLPACFDQEFSLITQDSGEILWLSGPSYDSGIEYRGSNYTIDGIYNQETFYAGRYTCAASPISEFQVSLHPIQEADVDFKNVTCLQYSDGEISVNLTNNIATEILWSTGDTTNQVTNLSAGNYSVSVTDTFNCTRVYKVTIISPEFLYLETSTTPDTNLNCLGKAIATGVGGTPPYHYLWDDSLNQTTDTAFNLCQGLYCVTVTDENGCTRKACEVQVNNIESTGSDPLNEQQELILFPNPNNGHFTVNFKEPLRNKKVWIYDFSGRCVRVINSVNDNNLLFVDVSDLNEGSYFIKIEDSNDSTTKVFTVVH